MSIKDEYRILEFAEHGDERGNLVIAEGNQDIPFEINKFSPLYHENEIKQLDKWL